MAPNTTFELYFGVKHRYMISQIKEHGISMVEDGTADDLQGQK